MSAKGRPEREYRSAQREGTPMTYAAEQSSEAEGMKPAELRVRIRRLVVEGMGADGPRSREALAAAIGSALMRRTAPSVDGATEPAIQASLSLSDAIAARIAERIEPLRYGPRGTTARHDAKDGTR